MNKSERQELANIVFGLASNFGDNLNQAGLELWATMFEQDGVSIDQIRQAAGQILRKRKISKMPTYAEFIEYIHGDSKDKAQRQADAVLDFLRRHGAKAEPRFEDPVTAYLMSVRWQYQQWASSLKESEVVWWRKEFIEAYQSYAKNPETIPTERRLEGSDKVKQLTAGIGG